MCEFPVYSIINYDIERRTGGRQHGKYNNLEKTGHTEITSHQKRLCEKRQIVATQILKHPLTRLHGSRQGKGYPWLTPLPHTARLPRDDKQTIVSSRIPLPRVSSTIHLEVRSQTNHLVFCAGRRRDHDLLSYAYDGGRGRQTFYHSKYTYVERHRCYSQPTAGLVV